MTIAIHGAPAPAFRPFALLFDAANPYQGRRVEKREAAPVMTARQAAPAARARAQTPENPPKPGFWAMLKLRLSARRERRALLALSDEALRDIGVSREAAEAEAKRRFWDAPKGR